MGLLDDAIREHLELKRLRGADPGEVAHEEQEALGPVRRETATEHSGPDYEQEEEAPATSGSFFSEPESDPDVESSEAAQETVEINMDAELDRGQDGHEGGGPRDGRAESVAHPDQVHTSTEESLEWEVPGHERADESESAAAPNDESDPSVDGDSEPTKHVEDVLEETPDFLRETPEQERLWFEQRPPRDFDFNE